jgi:hypothetical protein
VVSWSEKPSRFASPPPADQLTVLIVKEEEPLQLIARWRALVATEPITLLRRQKRRLVLILIAHGCLIDHRRSNYARCQSAAAPV